MTPAGNAEALTINSASLIDCRIAGGGNVLTLLARNFHSSLLKWQEELRLLIGY